MLQDLLMTRHSKQCWKTVELFQLNYFMKLKGSRLLCNTQHIWKKAKRLVFPRGPGSTRRTARDVGGSTRASAGRNAESTRTRSKMSTRRAIRLFEICMDKADNFVSHFRTSSGSRYVEVKIYGKLKKHSCTFRFKFVSEDSHILCKSTFRIKKFSHVRRFQKLLDSFILGFA